MAKHGHLRRLAVLFSRQPIIFITTCVHDRRAILAIPEAAEILVAEWRSALPRHGWRIGQYVIMPDHVHFFATPERDDAALIPFMRAWKQWTAKQLHQKCDLPPPLWQEGFFDHALRSEESYADKREYVLNNPVRAGLVARPELWPYAGWIDFD